MAGTLAGSTTCRITDYQVAAGYAFQITSASPSTGVALGDTLRRVTRLYIHLTDNASDPQNDPVTDAVVNFGDRGPGPVSNVGQVVQQGDGSLRVEVSLPREDFEAFWNAIRGVHDFIAISWNDSREVVEFTAWGFERLAADEESRKRTDTLRQELNATVIS
jgi:hypothetical protein